jgi:hypothetical protein
MTAPAPATRPRKPATALATAALLTAGLAVCAASTAPPAHAATTPTAPATTVTAPLDVSIVPGSAHIGPVSVTATIAYTCTGPVAATADLRLTVDHHYDTASAEQQVPCSATTVSATKAITVPLAGASARDQIDADATLTDGTAQDTDSATLGHGHAFLTVNPAETFPGDGTVTLTGTYECAQGDPAPTTIFVTAEQDTSQNEATAGTGLIDVPACDATVHTWTTTIKGSITGDAYTPGKGLPVIGGLLGGLAGFGRN